MKTSVKKRSKKAGLRPGSLVHVGTAYEEQPRIRLVRYDETSLVEKDIRSVFELADEMKLPGICWINLDGLQNVDLLEQIGTLVGIHPLVMEDILNTDHRPKAEDFEEYIFVLLKKLHHRADRNLQSEQISVLFGKGFVLSFQEKETPLFDPIRERLRAGVGKIRKAGADYLAHHLMDAVVDEYFVVLEDIEERIESLENDLVGQSSAAGLHLIHRLRRELILLRKSLWPLREAISLLQRADSPLIADSDLIYFKDISDHIIAIIDTVDTFRDMLAGMLDIYLSSTSIKLNAIMKVLTVIATIFMPLTFLAGVYGMNFKVMPELDWHWGYPAIWAVMLTVAGGMLILFKKKKWL